MAKSARKKIVRREYTKADVRELRAHSKARTPVVKIAKACHTANTIVLKQRGEFADNLIGGKRWLNLADDIQDNFLAIAGLIASVMESALPPEGSTKPE